MQFGVRFKNPQEVKGDTERLGKMLRIALKDVLKDAAALVEKNAVAKVRVRTGKTRDSLGSMVERGGMRAHVGSNWMVSRFLEHGTVYHTAQPYLRPALDESRDDVRAMLSRAVKEAINKVAMTT